MATTIKRSTPYQFFLSHSAYSYDAKNETPLAGRRRCARALAYAEERARLHGCSFEWSIDPDFDSSDFSDEQPSWSLWQVVGRTSDGKIFASLGGIDFGRDGEPWGDPYRRVIEAELATELPMEDDSELEEGGR